MLFIYFFVQVFCFAQKEMLMEFEMEMNSRTTHNKKTERTRNPSIILLYSPFTLICRLSRKERIETIRKEKRRKEKKCLEFASIYTYCVITFSPPSTHRSLYVVCFSLQSILNMFMRSFFFTLCPPIPFCHSLSLPSSFSIFFTL